MPGNGKASIMGDKMKHNGKDLPDGWTKVFICVSTRQENHKTFIDSLSVVL